jgi:type 2 lantibiotic biosynthesis protein LanM
MVNKVSHSFHEFEWVRALTLAERIRLFSGMDSFPPASGFNPKLAQERLSRWRAQPQFTDEAVFTRWLGTLGVDEEQLLPVLARPEVQWHQHLSPPAWLETLAEAYATPASAYADPAPGEEELAFLDLIQPLVDRACDQLMAGINELEEKWDTLPFYRETIEDVLLMNLPGPLLLRVSRTLVLELNVARLEGRLEGDTPPARFESFIKLLRRPEEAIAILAEYPVLARQLVNCIDQWLAVSLEFLGRLCADWPAIQENFSPNRKPGRLVELAGGAGDTHRGGRSVMIAHFESGFRIVYKPKSMTIDIHFQELLVWLNERGCRPSLRTLSILDRDDYGWVEYVEHLPCQSIAEIQRFYQRLGAYLGLLYAINASDFHLENLIAMGEHPLLIDLETLFNPEIERFAGGEAAAEAAAEAARTMLQSVLVAGMLPQRLWSGDEYGGVDISGFGGEEGQLSPDRVPQPAAAGTDEMHYERERLQMAAEANRPHLDGVAANALDHIEDIITGFRGMYQLLLAHREVLLAVDGPIAQFREDETRVLVRPTRTYDQLLFESFHPDTLRDALDRDMLLDRLWLVVPRRDYMANVIAAEQADLNQGDIPVFTSRPSSLMLHSASGEPISGVLLESGMDIARRRISQISIQDQQRQEWFIRTSLATLAPYEFGLTAPAKSSYRLPGSKAGISRHRLITAARAVADQLVETAILGEADVSWLGLVQLAGHYWDIGPLGMDLYQGIPGIALFLAYAGNLLDDERCTVLARRALNGILRHVDQFSAELPEIGGFEGWGGILYTLTHLGVLWEDPAVLDRAGDLVNVIAGFIDEDELFGIVGGAAGAICALLAYQHTRPSDEVLQTAIACGDHLLATGKTLPSGRGWVIPGWGSAPLAGFGYGAAGIGGTLLALSAATGHKRFQVAGRQAFDYERSIFSAAANNWPDLRQFERPGEEVADGPRFPVAWCHGAGGVALSRLLAWPDSEDKKLGNEIQMALHTVQTQGFGQTHSLCHGDLGNLEILMLAGRILGDDRWRDQADTMGGRILDSIVRDGWQCGGPGSVELPGLMLGIAGIGYQLLRLAEPDRIPSVLALAPPVH